MIDLRRPRPRRRPSLTPMIDVVFLLLVFFMLASRLGVETVLDVAAGGQGVGDWQGPPRLVDLRDGGPALNGVPVALADLPARLAALMASPADPVILRAGEGVPVQALVDLIAALRGAGLTGLILAE